MVEEKQEHEKALLKKKLHDEALRERVKRENALKDPIKYEKNNGENWFKDLLQFQVDKLQEQIEALPPASAQAATTTVNDHTRERQGLEEQLKAAVANEDFTAAAKLQQQIL